MNRLDYSFDEYQASILRTANRDLDWQQTVENCLLGLIGELGEVVASLNSDSTILNEFVSLSKIAETLKKTKYHGKLAVTDDWTSNQYIMFVNSSFKTSFNPEKTDNLPKELGDTLYYLTWLTETLGYEASEVAQTNVEKLRKRYGDGFSVEKSLNRIA